MSNIAIYGFGRIGRSMLKSALKRNLFTPVAIADIRNLEMTAAVFQVDSNYGRWHEDVSTRENSFLIGGRDIPYIDSSKEVPDWGAMGIDLVVDCTGRAVTRAGAQVHLDRGAKRVLISAASKTLQDCDAVLLPGINMDSFDPQAHKIVSMASCTTNALAAVVKVMLEQFGIQYGLFTTVHAYTNTQSLTDQPMRDRRDSWAAAENIIPSSSGAAKALKFIWPELKITGKAYRVPVKTGSIAELNLITERAVTVQEVNAAFIQAASEEPLKGIMDVLKEEWASARIVGDYHSSIIDLPLTQVQEGNFVSVAAWYDNEWGYSSRLAETAAKLGG
ncbi:glyceraldehyde-3-phosphate dehydrogenase [Ktedonobacter sp. SOSP1-85]|uniref:type I glyceraldehyde-3-phosphate dehydrogenase n=1 Tax=Ktedonobacter sp. SOSP1-85 TaxID=2778367 RepID=UPI00191681C8|nr:glyceraldehyde 3-phosphate dehydrogenase NAD-binding domain-containing protein [Ktedonobacter sp. SOSP1-85]GHO79900.1 glyceraldehyde-3-phosphate dehydrogenase [Ktedonobacter sp. SOSP1-85]